MADETLTLTLDSGGDVVIKLHKCASSLDGSIHTQS